MILKTASLLALVLATASLPVMAQNIAVVNGKPIPTARADLLIKQLAQRGQKDSPEVREKIKEQLIDFEVLSQEAAKMGLEKDEDVKTQLALAREQILISAMFQDHVKKNPIKDETVKAEYDKLKASASDKEYHARHILVDNEDDAKAIIVKLKGGAKFEDLAKEKSKDSAASGGDLDWVTPNGLAQPFAEALVTLKKGQFTETPVHTKFGYHVIKLEDTRPAKIPSFEEVKANIAQQMQQKELEKYRMDLRAKAKIQ